MNDGQTWVEVGENDRVFDTAADGRVVVITNPRGLFGSIVRRRDGKWMRRTDEFTFVDPRLIDSKSKKHEYIRGRDLPKE